MRTTTNDGGFNMGRAQSVRSRWSRLTVTRHEITPVATGEPEEFFTVIAMWPLKEGESGHLSAQDAFETVSFDWLTPAAALRLFVELLQ